MFDAQILFPGAAGAPLSFFGPWGPRGGDNMRATVDVVGRVASQLTIRLFTKNTEDAGDGVDADAGTSIITSATGRATAEWTSGTATILELVRYKYTVQSTGTGPGDWVLFRMLAPVWFDTVRA